MTTVNLSEAEETFCMYKLGNQGSFTTSLIDTVIDIIKSRDIGKI